MGGEQLVDRRGPSLRNGINRLVDPGPGPGPVSLFDGANEARCDHDQYLRSRNGATSGPHCSGPIPRVRVGVHRHGLRRVRGTVDIDDELLDLLALSDRRDLHRRVDEGVRRR